MKPDAGLDRMKVNEVIDGENIPTTFGDFKYKRGTDWYSKFTDAEDGKQYRQTLIRMYKEAQKASRNEMKQPGAGIEKIHDIPVRGKSLCRHRPKENVF